MTTFQLIMAILMIIGFVAVFALTIAFIVEAAKAGKVFEKQEEPKEEEPEKEEHEEENYDIRDMLAQLEEEANEVPAEEPAAEEVPAPVVEVVKEPEEAPVEEVQPENVEEAPVEETAKEEAPVEETAEEEAPKTIIIKEVTTETVGTDFDYNTRLEKIVESKDKLDKEIAKTKNAILKYERTERRKERNQKMLDRRAVELTNLNLMMYSVTDIKNIDEDKKQKQEELTTHIAELKASIQDAEEYLMKNREKYEHDKKMLEFYNKEEARYADEIAELEELIKNSNSVTSSTTTTTTTTETEDGEKVETVETTSDDDTTDQTEE